MPARTVLSIICFAAAFPPAAVAAGPAASTARSGPEKVLVGAYINDIQTIDLKTHSYTVDLYLWFRWKSGDVDPAASFEFMNPYELWGHTRTTDYEKPLLLPDGRYYQVVRTRGAFSKKLLLDDYPFDRQVLTVELEDPGHGTDALAYEPDPDGVAVNPGLVLPGFKVGRPRLVVEDHVYPTNFGDTRERSGSSFSRARVEIPIMRPMLPYTIKLLIPIVCVVICASLMFLFHPKYVDSRVGIGITALLTIVALQITLNDDLPEVAYLVLLDKVYLLAYMFVIGGLGVVVRTTWMLEHDQVERAVRVDRMWMAGLWTVFMAVLSALLLLSR